MYAGKTSAILFNALVIPADKWEIDLSVESLDYMTIKVLRDANVNGLMASAGALPLIWSQHGIPSRKISSNIRDVKGNVHGFYKTQAVTPTVGSTLSLVLRLQNLTFFSVSQALVTSVKLSAEVKGAVEFDIEWESIGEVDYRGGL
jgi:hypothetical protein